MISEILGYNLNHYSRLYLVPARFLHVAYLMKVEKKNVNMCEIVRLELLDNIEKLKKTKSVVFRFEFLLIHMFFQVIREFPGLPD